MRFKKLLVGVDFTPPSHEALRTGMAMAADTGAQLVLAHVSQPIVNAITTSEFPTTFMQEERRAVETELSKWQAEAHQAGARLVSTTMLVGTPWHELVELLRGDESFDLAIVGTHGRTGLRHIVLGSVAERVVRHAPCAVLVVRVRE